jgi:hypothetical protein
VYVYNAESVEQAIETAKSELSRRREDSIFEDSDGVKWRVDKLITKCVRTVGQREFPWGEELVPAKEVA